MGSNYRNREENTWTAKELVMLSLKKHKFGKFANEANAETVLKADADINDSNAMFDALRTANSYIFPTIAKLEAQGRLVASSEFSQAFRDFHAEKPQYAIDGNESLLLDALAAENLPLDVDNLVYVSGQPAVAERLGVTTEYANQQREERYAEAQAERERVEAEAIRAEMLGWLTNGPREAQLKQANAHYSVYAKEVKNETARLASMSHTELVVEVNRRREVRRAKGLSAQEYRAEVAASRAAGQQPVIQPKMQAALNHYETLPTQYTTRGGLTVDMDRAGILKVANSDSFAFRELVRRFGADSINDILAGRV